MKRFKLLAIGLLLLSVASQAQLSQTLEDVQFLTSSTAVAVGGGGSLVRSVDGGASWTTVPGFTDDFRGLTFPTSSTGWMIGVAGSSSNIYRSNDGGASWTRLATIGNVLTNMKFADLNNGIAVGNSGVIFRSSDGGASWSSQSSGTTAYLEGISYPSSSNATAVGQLGTILTTANGGSSWSSQSSGNTYRLRRASFVGTQVGTLAGYGGNIRRTGDGGASWTAQSSPYGSVDLYAVNFSDANNGWIVGPGGLIIHTSNGSSWSAQTSGVANALYGVHFRDASNGLAVGNWGTILRTSNGGASWAVMPITVGSPTAPAAPTLLSPATGAVSQPTSLTLSWNSSTGAATYRIQVSTSSAFTTTVVDDATLTGTSRVVSGLSANTTYYWRVNATNVGGTSGWSATWNFTTSAVLPTVLTTTASAVTSGGATLNGTVNPNGATATGWFEWGTSSTLATYSSTSSQALGSGTVAVTMNANVTGLSPNTTYYYRAAGQNGGGTQRDGILSFTTSAVLPTVLTTAASAVTSGGATLNGTVNPNGATTTGWFEWGTSSTLATSTSTASQSLGSGTLAVASTSNLTGLSPSTIYYYRAVGQNSAGTQRDGILNFTTSAASLPAPGAFNLLSPATGAVNQPVSGTLSWQASSNAAGYDVYMDGNNPPTTIVSANQAATSYTYSGANGLLYFWKVVAKNSTGNTTSTGLPWSFTTILAAPGAPALLSPATGAVNQPTGLTLSWNASAGAATYRIQVSTGSTFSSTVVDDATLAVTSRVVSALSVNTTYYWRVNATNVGGTSSWSATWNFTTSAVLPTVLTTAASAVTSGGATLNGTVNPNGATTTGWFEWGTSSTLATSTSTASQALGSGTVAVASTANLTGLSSSTTYYYRAVGQNSGGTQRDGILSFTTSAVLPTVLTTAASAVTSGGATLNGTVNPNGATTTGWFEWGTSSTLATSTSTASQALGSGTVAVASTSNLTGLSPSTIYYYRAVGQNSAGTQRDGILNFTTPAASLPAPGAFNLASPTTGATNQPVSGTLSWQASSNAAGYDVYMDGNNPPTTVVSANQSTTSYAYSGITGHQYFWKVVAKNGTGSTTASGSPWSFTVVAITPTVLTTAATSVTNTAATLNGTVNPNGISATAWFEWGTSSTLATYTSTTAQSVGSGTTPAAASAPLTGLNSNSTYYFRVAAQNSAGITRDGILSFTTQKNPPPPSPSLSAPGNGSAGQPTSLSVAWNAATGATSYRLTVSTSSTFSSGIVYDDSTLTGTTQQVGGLNNGLMYYWHVSAKNDGGSSAASSAWNFTTQSPAAVFSVNRTSIDFGTVSVGKSKKDSVTVTNTGGSNLTISSIQSTTTAYTVSPSNGVVNPGGSLKVYITFTPGARATITGQISFVHDAAGSPGVVGLTGVGGGKGGKRTPSSEVAVIGEGIEPTEYALQQNYPNPFNPTTKITYDLPEESLVRLVVYNMLGQEVATLVNDNVGAGSHTVTWNATSNSNEQLPSGTYIYRIKATSLTTGTEFELVRKMAFIK